MLKKIAMNKFTYEELRNILKNEGKYPKCQKIQRCPLIHKGFPGTFNLSFTEYDVLREFGRYTNFDRDFIFSTIQSCVRPQDLFENIKENLNLWKYLSVFEMSDIIGQVILKEEKVKEVHSFQLRRLIEILTKLGLKREKIFPSYHTGGKISEVTNGKYTFDFTIPEDSFTKEEFINAGIPKENLIPDNTRDTFLSLHLHMPTPWGYRNEINYNIGTKENPLLLDIATLEYFFWEPVYSSGEKVSKNITGLNPLKNTISVGGIGVERLFMAVNNLQEIQQVDYIKTFYDKFKQLYPKLKKRDMIQFGESIRALHRIYSDVKSNNIIHFGENRKNKIKSILQIMFRIIPEFDRNKFNELLKIHAEIQPWHENLLNGISPTIERIEINYSSKK